MSLSEALSPAGVAQADGMRGSPVRVEIPPAELLLRPLRTPTEIAAIESLRRQIRLPADVVADPGFAALEKKGTKPASSQRSNGAGVSSGR